jgi:hypothetical protein
MIYVIDIDGVICTNTWGKYELAVPFISRIYKINKLYEEGNEIVYYTARGSTTGINWRELTLKQFEDWGVKYHSLIFSKPQADVYVDDKGVNSNEFFKR